MEKLCVFCGSSNGNNSAYTKAARQLANNLIQNDITLVYGGARVGLMGTLANHILEKGGRVIGIMPEFLIEKEVAHTGLTQLIQVSSMHERKERMQKISDGFIALPGGLGTVEEIFEMITWGQLNIHQKPCAFLNVNGYYDHIDNFLNNAVREGFIDKEYQDMIIIEDDPDRIIVMFIRYIHPTINKIYRALNK